MLCLALCGALSGCRLADSGADSLLAPPKPTGNLFDVQRALEESVSGEITLKYPTEGEHRSAIILEAVTSEAAEDAVVFYSTTSDKTVTMHINLIRYLDGGWRSVADLSTVATGVEQVRFTDLDGDGSKEILVGWNIFGNVDKQLSVYSVSGGALLPRLQEKYSEFLCCDLNEDQKDELLLATLNTSDKTAAAKLYALNDASVTELGRCTLDGGVSFYDTPVVSRLSTGRTAVFLDAFKGTGMLTEILYFENNRLQNPMYDPQTRDSNRSLRSSTVTCTDIDGNGILELPMLEALPGMENAADTERLSVTKWCVCNGRDLLVVRSAVMNYLDGYSFDLPERWKNAVTMTRRTEDRMRVFSLWNASAATAGPELLRIQVISEAEWDSASHERGRFFELDRGDGVVYTAAVSGSYVGELAITKQEVLRCFSRIHIDETQASGAAG